MDLCDAYFVGVFIESLRATRIWRPIVKGERQTLDNLKRLSTFIVDYDLNDKLLPEIAEWIEKLSKYAAGEEISEADAVDLSDLATVLGHLIDKQLRERPVLELTAAGGLDQQALLELSAGQRSAFFQSNIWNALSDISKSDFSDAAKCLLAKAFTPAAMVTLRAAEEVVRRYFIFKTGNQPHASWRDNLDELRSTPGMKNTLVSYLDYIRDKRNEAEHPDKIFNLREAVAVFNQVVAAVHEMYCEMIP